MPMHSAHGFRKQGSIALDAFVFFPEEIEERKQSIMPRLITKPLVSTYDFQQLLHGDFVIILGKAHGA